MAANHQETIEGFLKNLRVLSREICAYGYEQKDFSEDLAMAIVSLSTALKFLNQEHAKLQNPELETPRNDAGFIKQFLKPDNPPDRGTVSTGHEVDQL